MIQAEGMPQFIKCIRSILNRTAVTPDDSRTQGLPVFVNAYQAVHLIRNADRTDFVSLEWVFFSKQISCPHELFPPLFGILLCKPRSGRMNPHFRCRRKSRSQRL